MGGSQYRTGCGTADGNGRPNPELGIRGAFRAQIQREGSQSHPMLTDPWRVSRPGLKGGKVLEQRARQNAATSLSHCAQKDCLLQGTLRVRETFDVQCIRAWGFP